MTRPRLTLTPSAPAGTPALEPGGPVARQPGEETHRLWGGRFAGGSAPALERLNRSLDVDIRLWPHDIRLSRAWAVGLWSAGVVTLDESTRLEQGLASVGRRLADGVTALASDEDVHTLIDRLLHEEIGDLAARLHTGRSRNDQVATATRLWTMDAAVQLDETVRALQRALLAQAEAAGDIIMPAYTHLQRAQPVLASHWLLSHFWPLERDRARISAAARAASVLPLGAGAVAGCAFPVPRALLKESLGFAALSENSIDAVADRDFAAELLFAIALLGTHLSRLAEDLIVYGSSEFGFVRFGDAYTTGSSMMPQKRNPDALELTRQVSARALGDLTALLATLKGLPSGYNKDLQEDKRSLFDAVDAMLLVLPATAGAVAELELVPDRMAAALSSGMMATDLADYLVRRGATFREAHAAVGAIVRTAEAEGRELGALPLPVYQAAHALFAHDVYDALSPTASIAARSVAGGTAPSAVREQLARARNLAAGSAKTPPRGNSVI